jgi:hypothetical protein
MAFALTFLSDIVGAGVSLLKGLRVWRDSNGGLPVSGRLCQTAHFPRRRLVAIHDAIGAFRRKSLDSEFAIENAGQMNAIPSSSIIAVAANGRTMLPVFGFERPAMISAGPPTAFLCGRFEPRWSIEKRLNSTRRYEPAWRP